MNKFFSIINKLKKSNLDFRTIKEIEEIKILKGKILSELQNLNDSNNLNDREFKVFSQFGEDGIINFLVKKTGIKDDEKFFVEIGVGDYSECNTKFLLMNDFWTGVVIEGNKESANHIKDKGICWKYGLKVISEWVRKDNIKSLIEKNVSNNKIGLLSLDIDGNDYWILNEIKNIKPIIIIVEWNSLFGSKKSVTTPYDDNFVREKKHFSGQYWGASIKAFHDLMKSRGYFLVGSNMAGNNLFFVREDRKNDLIEKKTSEAFQKQIFKDSRDENGKLNFLDNREKLKVIENLDVFDLEEKKMIKISELVENER